MPSDNKKRGRVPRSRSTKISETDDDNILDHQSSLEQNRAMKTKVQQQPDQTINDSKKKTTTTAVNNKTKGNSKQQLTSAQTASKKKKSIAQNNNTNKQTLNNFVKDSYQIDDDQDDDNEDEDEQLEEEDEIENIIEIKTYHNNHNQIINNNNNKVNQNMKKNQSSLQNNNIINNNNNNPNIINNSNNSYQSPQSLILEESKENTSECNSTSTKQLRRSVRNNTTDSKQISSNKTTPQLKSPNKNNKNLQKRVHTNDDQTIDELEPQLRKQIQQNFNSKRIEEIDSDQEQQNQSKNNNRMNQYHTRMDIENNHAINNNDNIVQLDDGGEEEEILLLQQQQQNKSRTTRQNYRQPKQKESIKNKHLHDNSIIKDDGSSPYVTFSQEKDRIYPSASSNNHQQRNNQRITNLQHNEQEQETELSQPKIRIQKINFNGFSDSDDCTGDSNSQNNQSAMKNHTSNNNNNNNSKKGNKSVTLIFQRNKKESNNNHNSIKEEIDGQSQSIQTGNLLISICNTDEHYPPLFNQKYLEENISMIQKKQCHVRQKRRLLQLDSINSISIDRDNRLYNLLDENVIKERDQGNLQILNGIVEYEQSLRPQPVTKQKVKCNCKKTKCLKLYCDCFNQGVFCSPECNCHSCSNHAENQQERLNAISVLKERNPDAFKPKIQTKEDDEEILVHNKGCNCKKSGCEKKYCECYNTGVKCSDQCKCEGCRNRDPSQLVKINNPNNPGSTTTGNNSSFSNHIQVSNKLNNGEQYINDDMFQSSNHSLLHHNNSNLNHHHHMMRQSQEDSIQNFSQNSKKFNMGEFNTNIPMRLGSGIDSQNFFSQRKFLISSFNFSQEELKDDLHSSQIRFSQNLMGNSQNNNNNNNMMMKFQSSLAGIGGLGGINSQIKDTFFDDNSQKSNHNLILKNDDDNNNTTIDISLKNGSIQNIVAKKD